MQDLIPQLSQLKEVILSISAGVISVLLDPERPCTFSKWVLKLFSNILFAGFVVFFIAKPFIGVIEWLIEYPINSKIIDLITATLALSAKDLLILSKETTIPAVNVFIDKAKTVWGTKNE